ncbi:hypothetical protein FPSE_06351 [Fusarium pseudograminearum CS3096]|uniref:Uncharacterized protein n=1 Tax=Fusarium pseudograminearum (strain CS3096) TaxID=1028729 RepID=K3UMR8_FUSPC|nr:hypothetical protein FPSE_06351 [Fusarium pseudograminearum CS3096]EKJ73471.1 hypothetical protein FPSE_06351 [Fusarium pseudograminearum CS3096]
MEYAPCFLKSDPLEVLEDLKALEGSKLHQVISK